jgi:hypothetical protein
MNFKTHIFILKKDNLNCDEENQWKMYSVTPQPRRYGDDIFRIHPTAETCVANK